jgi:TonB family protein
VITGACARQRRRTRGDTLGEKMTEAWKRWEEQTIDGEFGLREYVGGSDHSGVFRTARSGADALRAAIKLIPADPQSAKVQLSRWEQAAKISHPHLLRLYESGRYLLGDTEMLYVVMEYAGEDLSQILPQRALTAAETREMLKLAVEALVHLHDAGLVHGHLKPANVLVADEQVKLSIDGVCRIGERSGSGGKAGAYDPPEGSSSGSTPAGDVWSLGMTLVESLTQRLPVWERFQETEPALPETLPKEFHELVLHCLKRDPQRRWGLGEIAKWLQPDPAPAQKTVQRAAPKSAVIAPRTAVADGAKWRHAMPTIALTLAAVVLLGIIAFLNRRPETKPASSAAAEPEKVATRPAVSREAPAPKPEAGDSGGSVAASADAALASARTNPNLAAPAKSGGGDIVRGEVTQQVMPEVSEKARRTIEGRVRVGVKVHVDSSGSVTAAELESAGPSEFFAHLAAGAARQWKFSPATLNGENVPSDWILRFEFTSAGTTVRPAPTTP